MGFAEDFEPWQINNCEQKTRSLILYDNVLSIYTYKSSLLLKMYLQVL